MTDLRRLHLLLILLDITAEEPYNQQTLENERHTINVGVNLCVCICVCVCRCGYPEPSFMLSFKAAELLGAYF